MEAVIQSDYEDVKKLVMDGASVTKQDWNGLDSILYALKKNDWEILNLLMDFSKNPIDLNKNFFVNNNFITLLMLNIEYKKHISDNGSSKCPG